MLVSKLDDDDDILISYIYKLRYLIKLNCYVFIESNLWWIFSVSEFLYLGPLLRSLLYFLFPNKAKNDN